MVSRVLVGFDGSEMAERALEYAFDVHADAEITVVTVVGEPSPMLGRAAGLALSDDFEEAAEEQAHEMLDRARELAADRGVEVDTVVAVGHPARAIVDRAGEFDAVVIGSHGGDVADQLFIGNVARRVFRRSPVPVTAVR